MNIDETLVKQAMEQFASGVTVVTTEWEAEVRGLNVSAFASVSKEPQLVLVNIEKEARSDEFVRKGADFTMNVLTEHQEDLCMRFAKPGLSMEERLDEVTAEPSPTGGLILSESLAWMACEQWGG